MTSTSLGLFVPCVVGMAIKVERGSTVTTMTVGATVMKPLLSVLGLVSPIDRALVVVALGVGSTMGSYYNEPFFWVIHGCSGLGVLDVLRYFSVGTIVRGIGTQNMCYVFR